MDNLSRRLCNKVEVWGNVEYENELGEIISYLFDTECRRYGNYYVVTEVKDAGWHNLKYRNLKGFYETTVIRR